MRFDVTKKRMRRPLWEERAAGINRCGWNWKLRHVCWLVVLGGFPAIANAQDECANGLIKLLGATGSLTLCPAIASQAPDIAKQLAAIKSGVADNQGQMKELDRLIRGLNSVSSTLDLKRQTELLQNLSARLIAGQSAGAAQFDNRLTALSDDFESLQEQMLKVLSNQATAAKANAALQGAVGDAISRLDFTTAHDQLADIQAQLKVIGGQVNEISERTKIIEEALVEERLAPAQLQAALAAADMNRLGSINPQNVKPKLVEAALRERLADGKSVARHFFDNSVKSPEAIEWLDTYLKAGLDPDLTVPGTYYDEEALLADAMLAGNIVGIETLLHRGASPHPFQQLEGGTFPSTRFLFPLGAIAEDERISLQQKRDLTKVFLEAGAVNPSIIPQNNGWASVMYAANAAGQTFERQVGLKIPPTPVLCEKPSAICKAASLRSGEDWCGIVARVPKRLAWDLKGSLPPIGSIDLLYLLAIHDDQMYFLGLSSLNRDFVVVKVSKDASSWTISQFGTRDQGFGACKPEKGTTPDYCWRLVPLLRTASSDQLLIPRLGSGFRLEDKPCSSPTAVSSRKEPKTQVAFTTEQSGSLVGTDHRIKPLVLRDHPELIAKFAHKMVLWDIYIEQDQWEHAESLIEDPPDYPTFNKRHPAFVFDWSELLKTRPRLAKGQALDIFLRPDAHWSFLQREPGWSESLDAWVGIFAFPRGVELGRDYAAHEAAPLLAQQMKFAAARESAELWFSPHLPAATYDMDHQTLTFPPIDLAETLNLTPKPTFAETMSTYKLMAFQQGNPREVQRLAGAYRKAFPQLQRWRELTGLIVSASTLALDRQLRIASVRVSL